MIVLSSNMSIKNSMKSVERVEGLWTQRRAELRERGLVSPSINTMMFADGACEGRSRSEEEVMQGHRRRRATQRSPASSISPKGGGGTVSISLSLLLHDVSDIASSSLRELDAVALATNVMLFMGRDTNPDHA